MGKHGPAGLPEQQVINEARLSERFAFIGRRRR